jgi:predicted dienelactone hydrolase
MSAVPISGPISGPIPGPIPGRRLIAAGELAAVVLVAVVLAAACGGAPPAAVRSVASPSASAPAAAGTPARTASAAPARVVSPGVAGTYGVAERRMTFTEPAHVGVTGQHLGERSVLTLIRYPVARGSPGSWPSGGPFPLLMFAPGFQQCSDPYEHLLQAWASAGYVVASVDFPRTDCLVGSAAYEPDLVNQPGDVSYALGRLLALNAHPHDFLSGRLNPHAIAATGQSDGGDTVAALAADTCCQDRRLKAVAVLSGAEWPPMPGPYFTRGAPPMLFVQGNADTINPPWTSVQLYRADRATRYYLDLYGADHMVPYTGDNPVERLVARITLAFFDRYVLGQARALATMTRAAGASGGLAALGSGGGLPPDTG